jgi:hypothetical protein
MMAGSLLPSGYVQVKMRVPGKKNGVVKGVHILVASAFLPPPKPTNEVIDHRNHNKIDNRAANLEWVTRKENARRAVAAGRFHRNGKHVAAILSQDDVEEIRRTAGKFTRREHARKRRVHPSTIDDAISGRNHAGVPTATNQKPRPGHLRGQAHPLSKETESDVLEIARRVMAGERPEDIALDSKTGAVNIRAIAQGKTWSHITGIKAKQAKPREHSWVQGLAACKAWVRHFGTLASVKVDDIVDAFPIGWWIDRRRQEYKKKKLSKARTRILEELGIVWSPHGCKTERGLSAARQWATKHGDLSDVPITASIGEFPLGRWLGMQRTERNELLRNGKEPGSQQAVRFEVLTSLGINWHPKRGPKPSQKR